ncbi:hypothetical protein C8J57DRAFT_1301622 [Mycena rebaudengoi]|nr:hypothetical protein C8J57DRAFT_1301622 [Mycena rebaudengoi]
MDDGSEAHAHDGGNVRHRARALVPMAPLLPAPLPGTLVVVQDAMHTTGIPLPTPRRHHPHLDQQHLRSRHAPYFGYFFGCTYSVAAHDRRILLHRRIHPARARPVLLLPKFFANTKFERVHAHADTHAHPALPAPHRSPWSALRDRLGIAPAEAFLADGLNAHNNPGGAPNSMGSAHINGLANNLGMAHTTAPPLLTPPMPIPLDDRALMLAEMARVFHLGLGLGVPDVCGRSLPSPRINANGGGRVRGMVELDVVQGIGAGRLGARSSTSNSTHAPLTALPVPLARAATSPSSSTSTASTSRVEFQ